MGRKVDLTGKRSTMLTAVEVAHRDSEGKKVWLCRCDCGRDTYVKATNFIRGITKSCGCLRSLWMKELRRQTTTGISKKETIENRLIYTYRVGAEKRGLPFELTREEIIQFVSSPCRYCKTEPELRKWNKLGDCYYNGIDRADNTRGYQLDNCVPCCRQCNRSKRDLTEEQFIQWIERLTENFRR